MIFERGGELGAARRERRQAGLVGRDGVTSELRAGLDVPAGQIVVGRRGDQLTGSVPSQAAHRSAEVHQRATILRSPRDEQAPGEVAIGRRTASFIAQQRQCLMRRAIDQCFGLIQLQRKHIAANLLKLLGQRAGLIANLPFLRFGASQRLAKANVVPSSADDGDQDRDRRRNERRRQPRPTLRPFPNALGRADRSRRDRLAGEKATQIVGQRGGIAIAPLRIAGQALEADRRGIAGDARHHDARRRRVFVLRPPQRFQRRRSDERRPAGEQFVEHRAETVDVDRRSCDVGPGDPFRSQVSRRPGEGRTRVVVGGCIMAEAVFAAAFVGRARQTGQAEVGDLRYSFGRQQDVRRREIAMDDAGPMRAGGRL